MKTRIASIITVLMLVGICNLLTGCPGNETDAIISGDAGYGGMGGGGEGGHGGGGGNGGGGR